MKVWWLTVAYLLVTLGSVGLMALASKFPSVTALREYEHSGEKALGLFDGHQVWSGSWRLIIFGTLMQMAAVWIWD